MLTRLGANAFCIGVCARFDKSGMTIATGLDRRLRKECAPVWALSGQQGRRVTRLAALCSVHRWQAVTKIQEKCFWQPLGRLWSLVRTNLRIFANLHLILVRTNLRLLATLKLGDATCVWDPHGKRHTQNGDGTASCCSSCNVQIPQRQ